MSEQSWKQQVEDLDPDRNKDPVVYQFSNGGIKPVGSKTSPGRVSKWYLQGIYKERKLHGAYDGNNT